MTIDEVREKYLKFMESNGHSIVPSSGLVPENDPTTLFTGSGMQPMVPYLLGEKHPKGTRITDSQKCFRAEDIDDIGDNRHTTFFEMLGNWSFGDYFKEEQIQWIFEFLTTEIGLDPNKLYVTAFIGEKENNLPKDTKTPELWQKMFANVGIEANIVEMGSQADGGENGMQEGRIFYYDSKENWWSRAGVPSNMPLGEPGGPDSEIFYEFEGVEHNKAFGEHCHPACDCGRFMEIGNNVFMQYVKKGDKQFEELENKNIDFGGGLERITAAANDNPDIFTTDVFAERIKKLEELSGKSYNDTEFQPSFRIIADHLRAAEAMIAEDILPSNTEQGYFTRRLLRRSIIHADKLGIPAGKLSDNQTIKEEEDKFRLTLTKGLKEFEKHSPFILFTTYGFPIELTEEIAQQRGIKVDREAFDKEMQKHKETSRAGAEQKFKGGLADTDGKTVQYHTATHLILEGLRRELGDGVTQKGSNITSERARFDFAHGEKVERDVLDKVEGFVNNALETGFEVTTEEMSKSGAKESGATGAFWEKYPDVVTVYSIKDKNGELLSRELCGGPHVKDSSDIVGRLKIKKESSVAAGVRRIKSVLE